MQAYRHNIDLVVVMTGGFGKYDSPLALEHMDGAYVILNSVSMVFMQKMLNRGMPVVATVEDYFPLEVEMVMSDSRDGIRQAYQHLYQAGHRKIGFVADLSVVDFRVRYEALLSCYREQGELFDPSWLFECSEPDLPGGAQAAQQYLSGNRECTALIFAADLLAIGFEQNLARVGVNVPEDVAIVGVDNTHLSEHQSPSLSSVDQNIPDMVRIALDRLMARLADAPFEEQPFVVPQKLIIRESSTQRDSSRPYQPYIHPAIEMLDHNEYGMTRTGQGYRWLVELSRMWGPFMDWGCIGIWKDMEDDQADRRDLIIKDFFCENENQEFGAELLNDLVSATAFPCLDWDVFELENPSLITMMPIKIEGEDWGAMVIVDHLTASSNQDRYNMFYYYLVLFSYFVQREVLAESIRDRDKRAKELANRLEAVANSSHDGIWHWNLDSNVIEWNNRLLNMLGFTSEQQRLHYRNMMLMERVHPQDQQYVKDKIKSHLENFEEFQCKFRILKADGEYLWVDASGEAIREPDGHVGRFIGSLTDITEQKKSEKQLEFLSNHDALTGLPNRQSVLNTLDQHAAEFPNRHLAIVALDINRFRLVNDHYGHGTGDAVLKFVADTVKKLLRKTDIIGRVASDEFVLICKIFHDEEAEELCRRILEKVNGTFLIQDVEIPVHISTGAALFPKDSKLPQSLLTHANTAMNRAKALQLDSPVMFDSSMDVNQKDVLLMENQLRRSIFNKELYLVYQPKVDWISGKVSGVEALCRWNSPNYGQVSPSVFITLAEDIGYIQSIGNWVLDQVLATIKSWLSKGEECPVVSLNVSAGQLHQPDFARYVLSRIDQFELPPHYLNLEVTESAAIFDIDHAHDQLAILAEEGIEISLDDFGTGYSSLKLLNDLPLHWVKIDRSFVKELTLTDLNTGMVKSVTEMCHAMGYKVVVEGVETQLQLDIVHGLRCDQVQGYVYSKPVSLEEFENRFLNLVVKPNPIF